MRGEGKPRTGRMAMEAVDRFYEKLPAFEDIFDEESFYTFAALFTIASIVLAFLASRYITLKEKD
jgi:hypothetical protein